MLNNREKYRTEKYWMQLMDTDLWLICGDSSIVQRNRRRWGEGSEENKAGAAAKE